MYFQYKVINEITFSIQDDIDLPGVSICIRYVDVLDYQRLANVTGKKFRFQGINDPNYTEESYWEVHDGLTVQEILEYTPIVTELVNGCYIRSLHDYRITAKNATECSKIFRIDKFFVTEFICYKLQEKVPHTVKFKFSSSSIFLPGLLYEIQLNREFLKFAIRIKTAVHGRGLPWRSISLAHSFDRE